MVGVAILCARLSFDRSLAGPVPWGIRIRPNPGNTRLLALACSLPSLPGRLLNQTVITKTTNITEVATNGAVYRNLCRPRRPAYLERYPPESSSRATSFARHKEESVMRKIVFASFFVLAAS